MQGQYKSGKGQDGVYSSTLINEQMMAYKPRFDKQSWHKQSMMVSLLKGGVPFYWTQILTKYYLMCN